jgi:lysozyme
MKYRKIFVFMLMIVVMTTVYGQERYRAKPASTQLSIYSLPPLERAISCIKFYESWHGEKKHWPYVGWGHKVLPRERFTNNITKAQGDSILRADMMKFCRLFSKFGRDSVNFSLLGLPSGRIPPFRQ